jgi:hypothetical protein
VNGTDKNQNRTNFKRYENGAFDHAAIVIFESNYSIKGAVLAPIIDVLSLRRKAGHVKWSDVKSHNNAICILNNLKTVSGE